MWDRVVFSCLGDEPCDLAPPNGIAIDGLHVVTRYDAKVA